MLYLIIAILLIVVYYQHKKIKRLELQERRREFNRRVYNRPWR